MSDTIYALSSGALPAAIAIVRISGPAADMAAERLAGTLPSPRRASLQALRAIDGTLIDEALLLRFPAPRTATGEPLVELHLHGGRAVVTRLLDELSGMPGLREAEPGEFTRRALLNGRLDLTQAEGLADLLSAETEWQRRAALQSAGGSLRHLIEGWRDRLLILSAKIEAAIDYVGDEEETALDLAGEIQALLALQAEWREWLAKPPAELLEDGLRVVLGGPPNAGKSSLFNALIESDKAIVTPVAGTTRDLIEARWDLGGIPILLIDTAGLHNSSDQVERIGIERAERALASADILLWLGEPDEAPNHPQIILVHARADERTMAPVGSCSTSIHAPSSMEELRRSIKDLATKILPPLGEAALNRRQRFALQVAANAIFTADEVEIVLLAEEVRHALGQLDRLSGRQSTEDVLDTLFGRFCLGK